MLRAILLGSAFGIVWSLIPGFFSEIIRSPIDILPIFISGAVAGAIVSIVVWKFENINIIGSILLSPLLLMLGGGSFGFALDNIGLFFESSEAYSRISNSSPNAATFVSYSFYWLIPPICFLVVPLSALSTWLTHKALSNNAFLTKG